MEIELSGNTDLLLVTDYMGWANEVFYGALTQLPEDEIYRERKMLFGSIIRLLNHCYTMGEVWRSHLTNAPHAYQSRRPADDPSLPELKIRQRTLDLWYREFAGSISENMAEKKISFHFIGGGTGLMTRREILLHVLNHNSYHRGHIEGVFYQLEVEPPTTDLPVFLQFRT